jgi:tetraacyldisaccharide-1-P 4'-kinase
MKRRLVPLIIVLEDALKHTQNARDRNIRQIKKIREREKRLIEQGEFGEAQELKTEVRAKAGSRHKEYLYLSAEEARLAGRLKNKKRQLDRL